MRTILGILAAAAVCLAIDGATTPYNFSPATKAYSSQVNANFDSLRIPLNKMKDTLNLKMARYPKIFRNHDSTFQWMNIDTVKGPVWVDTLRVDTVRVGRGLSVAGPLMGSTGSFTSWLYTADSVLADAGIVTLGPVKGATGVFTSAVTVDSLKSTKGISATTGTFSGTVTVDSLKSTKGISYSGNLSTTNGIFSGKLTAAAVDTGSWVFTVTGFTGTVQGTAKYAIIGDIVTLSFDQGIGTSNTSTIGMSDIPAEARPNGSTYYFSIPVRDSGITVSGGFDFGYTGGCHVTKYGGVFATSGSKGILPFSVSYIKSK
jgi:hypothetical protein